MFRIMILIGMISLVVGCAAPRGARPGDGRGRAENSAAKKTEEVITEFITVPEGRYWMIRAGMTIVVHNRDAAVDSIYLLAETFDAYISRNKQRDVFVEIPSECLTEFIRAVEQLGELRGRSLESSDFTERLLSHSRSLENLKAERNRYMELLAQAESDKEFSRIESSIRSFERRIEETTTNLRNLKHGVAFVPLGINVNQYPSTKPGPVGFLFYQLYKGGKWLFVRD